MIAASTPSEIEVPRSQSRTPTISLVSAFCFSGGYLLNIIAYASFQPLLAGALVYFLWLSVLRVTPLGGADERRMFRLVFAVGWLMSGIAALYANFLNDPSQTVLDAAWFYDLASGNTSGGSLEDLKVITEGAGAVVLWRLVYNTFAALGFDKYRYIGVLVNVSAVALSAVIAIKTVRLIYGNDESRIGRMVVLFSCCGLFWLFAAIHLRDSVVLLSVTALVYSWTRYLARSDSRSLALLIVATIIGLNAFALFRQEFLFVPLAMLFAGLTAMLLFQARRGVRSLIIYLMAFAGVAVAAILYLRFREQLFGSLSSGYAAYVETAVAGSDASSLGMALIVNQPMPVRLPLGFVYLYVFPIPFWVGFQLESVYPFFKSLNALFFYSLIPLLVLALRELARNRRARSPALMFQAFLAVGFSLGIAGTSLETRHLGAFLVPVFLVALLPDPRVRENTRKYRGLLVSFLVMMAAMHLVWFVAKL